MKEVEYHLFAFGIGFDTLVMLLLLEHLIGCQLGVTCIESVHQSLVSHIRAKLRLIEFDGPDASNQMYHQHKQQIRCDDVRSANPKE